MDNNKMEEEARNNNIDNPAIPPADGRCLISLLPDHVLEFAISLLNSSKETCIAAAVSPALRAIADSDAIWSAFQKAAQVPTSLLYGQPVLTLKKIYLLLNQPPLILDPDTSMWLDKETCTKCYMLAPTALGYGDERDKWRFLSRHDSRFDVAELQLGAKKFEISAVMDSNMLTHGRSNRPSTQESSTYSEAATYAAYMVFKLATGSTGMDHPHRAKIRFGGYKASHQVFLQIHGNKSATQNKQLVDHNEDELVPNSHSLSGTSTITRRRTGNHKAQIDEIKPGLDQIDPPCHGGNAYYPDKRADGWMEIQLGEFYSDDGEDDEVFISLVASEGDEMKRGLFVQGIEIRFQKWRTSPNARHHEKS